MKQSNFKLKSSITYQKYCEEMNDFKLLDVTNFSKKLSKFHWAIDGGYGLIQIYYEYSQLNYKKIYPVLNCLHGFFPGMTYDWIKNSEASFKSIPVTLIHNDSHLNDFNYLFGKHKKFILISNPYYYILDNYHNFLVNKNDRSGSVLFLPHSIGLHSNITYDIDKILSYVITNYKKYSPITFCIHPNDINENFIEKIKTKGFNVSCNGGRHDPKFLHRFFWLTHNKRYALMFDVSSHLELSVLSNLEIIRIPLDITYYLPINGGTNEITTPKNIYWPIFEQFYSNEINQKVLSDSVAITTGKNYFLYRNELRNFILSIEYYYLKSKNITNSNKYYYKLHNKIEPYIIKFNKLLKAFGLRLSGMRGQQQIYFSDTYYKLIENKKNNL